MEKTLDFLQKLPVNWELQIRKRLAKQGVVVTRVEIEKFKSGEMTKNYFYILDEIISLIEKIKKIEKA